MTKITAVTGSRADWGLLSPVLTALHESFDVRVVATGQHLQSSSLEAIKNEGFDPSVIDMQIQSDDDVSIAKGLGTAISGFANEFQNNRPDFVMVLGDRYEILPPVQAALIAKIPVVHLCGGDITEGAIDDSIRHAVTKMAHLHFVTNEDAERRVVQMGENPDYVFNVGSPGLDRIHRIEKLDRSSFFQEIDFKPKDKNIIVTFHPVTLESDSQAQCQAMLDALSGFNDIGILITGSNIDPEGQALTKILKDFADQNNAAKFYESLGSKLYLNALWHMDAMVGNSSSGLYESPSFDLPSVNIGNRQKGRLKAASVIDCPAEKKAIATALQQALSGTFENTESPYGDGHSAVKIVDILKGINDFQSLCTKRFRNAR